MKAVAVVVLIRVYLSSVEAIDPDASVCFANQKLSFFCGAKFYKDAKKSCEDVNSYLVKIDSANTTEVVNSLIDNVKCRYTNDIFIGATATPHPDYLNNGSKRIWKWLEGSEVFLPSEKGYQNWQSGQPNDFAGTEDCVILDKDTKKWKDTPCNDFPGEEKHYICQESTTVNHEVRLTSNEIRCGATTGSCKTHFEWYRDTSIVSYNSSEPVYQISDLTSSTLHYKNATIGDAGKYECFVYDKTNSRLIAIGISVYGTPEIIDIQSFKCNASLHILWKPQLQSLGFLHRIEATPSISRDLKKVVEVTPTNAVVHLTKFIGLKPSTKYHIKVVACKDVNKCSDEHATMKTVATTPGITYSIPTATIQQHIYSSYQDTCVVAWQWMYNAKDTFRITFYLL